MLQNTSQRRLEGRPHLFRLHRRRALPFGLGLPVVLWQMAFFVFPLVLLMAISFWSVVNYRLTPAFGFGNWEKVLTSPAFHRALAYTLQTSAVATFLALLIALPTAYVISFQLSRRSRELLLGCLIVPVFSSYLLRIYAWQIVLSPQGVINSLLTLAGLTPLPLLGGQVAMHIGLLTITLPLTIILLILAMTGIDSKFVDAARNLGARPMQVAVHVVLPAIRPALVLATATAFILSFSDFISPTFMTGSKPPTLAILIVDTVRSGAQWPRAAVIGLIMLTIVAAVLGAVAFTGRGSAVKERA